MGKPLFSKLHSIENDLKRIKITSNFVITFNHEEFCREYGIPITEEYPEENEKKKAFYDAGMENKGLIERRMMNGNRRNLYVFLTDKGKELTERVEREFLRLEEAAFAGLDEHEKELAVRFLSRIKENLEHITEKSVLTSYDLLHSKDFWSRQKVQKIAEILHFSASFVCKGADFLI